MFFSNLLNDYKNKLKGLSDEELQAEDYNTGTISKAERDVVWAKAEKNATNKGEVNHAFAVHLKSNYMDDLKINKRQVYLNEVRRRKAERQKNSNTDAKPTNNNNTNVKPAEPTKPTNNNITKPNDTEPLKPDESPKEASNRINNAYDKKIDNLTNQLGKANSLSPEKDEELSKKAVEDSHGDATVAEELKTKYKKDAITKQRADLLKQIDDAKKEKESKLEGVKKDAQERLTPDQKRAEKIKDQNSKDSSLQSGSNLKDNLNKINPDNSKAKAAIKNKNLKKQKIFDEKQSANSGKLGIKDKESINAIDPNAWIISEKAALTRKDEEEAKRVIDLKLKQGKIKKDEYENALREEQHRMHEAKKEQVRIELLAKAGNQMVASARVVPYKEVTENTERAANLYKKLQDPKARDSISTEQMAYLYQYAPNLANPKWDPSYFEKWAKARGLSPKDFNGVAQIDYHHINIEKTDPETGQTTIWREGKPVDGYLYDKHIEAYHKGEYANAYLEFIQTHKRKPHDSNELVSFIKGSNKYNYLLETDNTGYTQLKNYLSDDEFNELSTDPVVDQKAKDVLSELNQERDAAIASYVESLADDFGRMDIMDVNAWMAVDPDKTLVYPSYMSNNSYRFNQIKLIVYQKANEAIDGLNEFTMTGLFKSNKNLLENTDSIKINIDKQDQLYLKNAKQTQKTKFNLGKKVTSYDTKAESLRSKLVGLKQKLQNLRTQIASARSNAKLNIDNIKSTKEVEIKRLVGEYKEIQKQRGQELKIASQKIVNANRAFSSVSNNRSLSPAEKERLKDDAKKAIRDAQNNHKDISKKYNEKLKAKNIEIDKVKNQADEEFKKAQEQNANNNIQKLKDSISKTQEEIQKTESKLDELQNQKNEAESKQELTQEDHKRIQASADATVGAEMIRRTTTKFEKLIVLPLPTNVSDTLNQTWTDSQRMLNKMLGDSTKFIFDLQTDLSAGISNRININPGQYKKWEKQGLRSYTLSWRFIPENADDAKRLLKLVNYLKRIASPSKQALPGMDLSNDSFKEITSSIGKIHSDKPANSETASFTNALSGALTQAKDAINAQLDNVLLWSPNFVKIKFGNPKLQESIRPVLGAITNIKTNWTTASTSIVETFGGGVPKSVELDITIEEVVQTTREDFDSSALIDW